VCERDSEILILSGVREMGWSHRQRPGFFQSALRAESENRASINICHRQANRSFGAELSGTCRLGKEKTGRLRAKSCSGLRSGRVRRVEYERQLGVGRDVNI
jgi:hypothetical protein